VHVQTLGTQCHDELSELLEQAPDLRIALEHGGPADLDAEVHGYSITSSMGARKRTRSRMVGGPVRLFAIA
jgi:hypothetical protein